MPIKKNRSRLTGSQKRKAASNEEHDYTDVLEDLVPVADLEPEVKVVLYGKAGTGKTTLAASFPKPILFLDFREKGTDSVRDVKDVYVLRVKTSQQVDDIYWAARKGKLVHPKTGKPFKTIVLDTISGAQAVVIREVIDLKKKDVAEGSEGQWGSMTKQDWGTVSTQLKEWINNYRDLEDMNVVFIAHDRTFGGGDDDDNDAERIAPVVGPALSPATAAALNAAVNTIGNTFIRERTKEIKLGKGKKQKKTVISYCLRVGPHAYYTTKIRKPKGVQVPAVLENPTYEDLLEYIEGDV